MPPPQLELSHLRPCKGHRRHHPWHLLPPARQLSPRPLGRRRETRIQALRALGQHPPHRRSRLHRDNRHQREPGCRARQRLLNGTSQRDGLLGKHAAALARRIHPCRLRRHCPHSLLAGGGRVDGQRRGQLLPHRVAALPRRPGRQARRIRGLARDRNLPPRPARPRGFRPELQRL